jgi:hypothetical protein
MNLNRIKYTKCYLGVEELRLMQELEESVRKFFEFYVELIQTRVQE